MKHFFLIITGLQLCVHGMAIGKTTEKESTASMYRSPAKLAEDIVIRGKVTDENGQALIGVNIKSGDGNKGTVTDKNGNYTLTVSAAGTKVTFSFIGYISHVVTVKATEVMNVQMLPDPKALGEVVVTALGIKRDEKALGYSATVVKGEQLTDALSNNWTDALSGKIAGVNLIRSNSGPTGSNRIVLRGENNLDGNDEALIVVDGVVINQGSGRRTAITGESAYGTSSDNMPADYGSGLNDINPEDIESITVLKGPGASALYGQRGANGALIITTKSGSSKRKGLGVTFSSNGSLETVNRWPDLQYEYGQGTEGMDYYSFGATADGASTSGTSSAYGPRFDKDRKFFQYDPVTQTVGKERTPWVPYTDKINKFFTTAGTLTNTVSVDGGTDKTTARFSFTNVANKWILPNTGYGRNTVSLSVNSKVNDKLQISSKINYTNKTSDNLPGAGYGNQSIMYWYIFWQPNADPDWLRNYWAKGLEGKTIKYPFSSFPENPYAISHEFLNASDRNGITGNVQATYNFTKELSLLVRTSVDFGYEQRAQSRPFDAGAKLPFGSYRTQNIFSMERSTDFLLRYNKKVGDFEFSVTGGGSALRNNYNKDETRADSLVIPGIFSFANSAGPLITIPRRSKYAINSFYGLISAGYKNFLYLDLTARQDWNSVLATPERTENAGFFYPSMNTSFIVSEVVKLPSSIDFAKLRFSVAGVGSGGTEPYFTSYYYDPVIGSDGELANPTLLANGNLVPLKTVTYEAGAVLKMFKNRLGLDLAIYTGNTKNQIIRRKLDPASGYPEAVINAGVVNNRGIEVGLNGTPVQTKDFKWNTNVVFSANRNHIKSLPDSFIVLRTGPIAGGAIVATVGGSMGDMYGRGYQRAPDGQIIYDATTGFAKITEGIVYLGNTSPKWKLGWTNEFQYKQFRFTFLFDGQYGAVAHSLMNYKLAEQGKTKITLPGRYSGMIGNGVVDDGSGKFVKNTTIATDIDEYYRSHYGADNAEGSTFSTDFIKFREARVEYGFSPKLIKRLGLQKAVLGFYGRNLFIWSPWPMFDPEFGTISDTGGIVQGFETAQFPSTRSFGFNLVLGF
ncbi:SusC/RagA family TonB-linked outer membrane protein [Chitinophaga sp. SYP-B3965]|uniref:SusC/RagA family TonB-linked outer membrane protein n=1 Tax=Chitinophaga sp. SYP-B3965 TaxID=2663120 RepID=UPI001299D188|nr:SusC/RagA family TonB-linked outer membrane protein [Chitinophaga sp. SYP-B3965]MRG47936.1 SusC/RagA family TonB-linked outer membrane protein [Chitinophaga sp. SYP-B3965]